MVRYLCEITTHKGRVSTHLHHLVLLNKEKKNKNQKVFKTKNCNSLQLLRYGSLICSAYGIWTRDLHSDSVAFISRLN